MDCSRRRVLECIACASENPSDKNHRDFQKGIPEKGLFHDTSSSLEIWKHPWLVECHQFGDECERLSMLLNEVISQR